MTRPQVQTEPAKTWQAIAAQYETRCGRASELYNEKNLDPPPLAVASIDTSPGCTGICWGIPGNHLPTEPGAGTNEIPEIRGKEKN